MKEELCRHQYKPEACPNTDCSRACALCGLVHNLAHSCTPAVDLCGECKHPKHSGRCAFVTPGSRGGEFDCGHWNVNPVVHRKSNKGTAMCGDERLRRCDMLSPHESEVTCDLCKLVVPEVELKPYEPSKPGGIRDIEFDRPVGDFSKFEFPGGIHAVQSFLTCMSCWQRLKDGEVHVCSKPRPDGKVSAVVSPWGESAIPEYVRRLHRDREILKAQVEVLEQQTLADRLIAEVCKEERDRLADEHLKQVLALKGEIYDLKHNLKEALFALKGVMRWADPYAVPGSEQNTEEHDRAKELLTTLCPGCRGRYTETDKHTCVKEGA
jgi:hypothetical protein